MKLLNIHLNTTYSFFESTITVDDAIKEAINNKVEFLSFTEKNNFFSLAEANLKCQKYNIKPIFGLDVTLNVDNSSFKYVLFAKNKNSFNDLKTISHELLNNNQITLNKILNNFPEILIIENPIQSYFKNTNKVITQKNYFIGLSIDEIDYNYKNNLEYKNLIDNYENILIFNNFNTLDFQDFSILETLYKINNKQKNPEYSNSLFFEMDSNNLVTQKLIIKTNEFIKSLYFPILKNDFSLPILKNKDNINSNEFLRSILWKTINDNFEIKNLFKNKEYRLRLKKEFEIISLLKFEDYFLIIQDWIQWAKKNNISIGPGRGSSAGSLVSYILGITEIDPIKYGLIFERFLNPKRISMPDIDVDVQDDRRYEIINYLINKYGYQKVANIVTFSTLGKKSAIRDILRSYNISPTKINQISKLISSDNINLETEVKNNILLTKELEQLNPNDSTFKNKIINQTSRISGFYRQTGTHAAGIIISKEPIINLIPTFKNSENFQQSQISMEYLEYYGLIKIDILGLKTLTTIKEIENNIQKNHNLKINWQEINFYDQKTFDILSKGNTVGIFQVESPIMVKALKLIKVNSFNDISAIISLNRPGPMAYVKSYANRKFNLEQVPKISFEYDEILKDTYGIIVYQEQIMQIAQKIAGMSFEEADLLRKIISKKQSSEMQQIKNNFISLAIKNNYSFNVANDIFNNIEKFADYGFNKSHAVAYSMLTFKMAYLKANFPLEFYASCISSANGAQDTISKFVNEAKSIGIEIISPNINLSEENSIISGNKIILPFGIIKGIGPEIIKLICENRKKIKQYKNFLHCFFNLSQIKSFGKSTMEILIKSGALRDFKLSQNTMLEEINPKSDSSLFIKQNILKNSNEIMDMLINFEPLNNLKDDENEIQKNEINLLGQVYNYSTIKNYEIENNRLIDTRPGNEYLIIVQCINVKIGNDKKNKQYQKIDFQDSSYKVVYFNYNIDEKLNQLKNKIVQIKFIRKNDDIILLKEWKVIK
ncbi:DNA polymerase III subunit alpha [Metamycoplasma canadense]|uniref:DNA-directed DNA polymerase n=1 Tax=Metamycoplasma canadense TaxID=29554 RepID=A0A077LBX4_9BACT|nr:DNA polymerase III subunit alpha [Metamycoplasma canadense]BAP39624.1 DNA polymerase III alpha subunit [Metamycoplasma canadense]